MNSVDLNNGVLLEFKPSSNHSQDVTSKNNTVHDEFLIIHSFLANIHHNWFKDK
jgi:hypothetical protein